MKEEKSISFFSRFAAAQESGYFIENMSMLIDSGIDVFSALQIIKSEARSRSMRKIIEIMIREVEEGSSFWRTLEGTGIVSEQVIGLVRAGENSGRLAENLRVVSGQMEKERAFKSKVKSAMMYPVLVLVVTFVVATGISWFILPRLTVVFDQLNVELPLITRILISVGAFLRDYGKLVVPAAIAGFFSFIYFVFFFSKTKIIGQKLLFLFPPTRSLIQEIELARLGYIFGTLLQAGLPIVDSLKSVSNSSSFENYKNFYRFLYERVDEGISIRNSFSMYKKTSDLIPVPVQHIITSGERTGKLDKTLIKIGETYEAKIDNTTKNLSTLMEPILLIIVWIGVVGVAVAVILPVYSLIHGVNQ